MKKKIAVIGLKGLPAFGGAATVGEHIIKELSDDYDFTVYAISSHAKDKDLGYCKQIIFNSSKHVRLNTFIYYIKSAFHALFRRRYDVIHLHHYFSTFIIPILKLRYKVITTTHGSMGMIKKNHFSSLVYFVRDNFLMKSNIVTNVSLSEQRFYKNRGENTLYIPNGVNLGQKIKSNISIDYDIVFSANRIIYLKGLHLLFEAIAMIDKKIKILIIGDTTHSPKYINELKQKYSDLNISFIGLLKDKEELFRKISKSKLFVFPSYQEAMSMMLLEVASLNIPIICSDIEANTDIFNKSEVLFFKTGNAEDLRKKIDWAINNIELMKENSLNARLKVEKKYLWSEIAKEYKKVYEQLISR